VVVGQPDGRSGPRYSAVASLVSLASL
jgi:hypothetical protein